jgi:hypothetical protein
VRRHLRQFPLVIVAEHSALAPGAGASSSQQQLLSVGTRLWGNWLSASGLKVRIYDYAIYADADAAREAMLPGWHSGAFAAQPWQQRQQQQAQALRRPLQQLWPPLLPRSGGPPAGPAPPPALGPVASQGPALATQRLLQCADVPVSVLLRTSRALPAKSVLSEYEGVLRRRLQRAGHDPETPALQQLLQQLRDGAGAASLGGGGHLAKGTLIHFQRRPGGQLSAAVDGVAVAAVACPALCAALLDAYLGPEPVSEEGRSVAGETLLALLTQPHLGAGIRPGRRQRLSCSGPGLEACALQLMD